MKTLLKLGLLSCLIIFSAWIAIALAENSLADFGLKVNELETRLADSLAKGYVPAYPDKKLFKAASPSAQAAFVRNALGWFKSYTETDAFKADYAKQRAAAKPKPPKAATADQKQADNLTQQRQDLEKMKQEIAQMPPDMQKQMQGALKEMEASINKQAKDPQMVAMMKQNFEQAVAAEKQTYQEQMAAWEKNYPENPKTLVANRLRQFLEVSQNIPFNAELVSNPKSKIVKFADPQYESQTPEWKLCFRAGREPVQAARAFVSEWLGQIEKK